MTAAAATGAAEPDRREDSLREWLAERSDPELATLLTRRPDLALPAPPDLTTLAARVVVRSSVQRAVDRLDAFALRLLGAVVAAHAEHASSPDAVAARLPDVAADIVHDRLAELTGLALIRPSLRTGALRPVGPVAPALGGNRRPGFGRSAAQVFDGASDAQLEPVLAALDLLAADRREAAAAIGDALADNDRLAAVLAAAPPGARAVLDRLADTPFATVPPGALRLHRGLDGRPTYDTDPDLTWLLVHGLLGPVDERTVELPLEVALAVRAAPAAAPPAAPEPPPLPLAAGTGAVDDVGTTAVLEVLRWVDALAGEWAATPPAVLRSGGLGVRELRRTAKALGRSEPDTALVVEVAAFAGLVGATTGVHPTFLPTTAYDAWTRREPSQRWVVLARAWLTMTRQPDLVGRRDGRDKVVTALGFDVERGTVPALRESVLAVLAGLAPGAAARAADDVLDRLAWQAPRQAGQAREAAAAVLREAAVLGVTAAGGLTSYGRAALAAAGGDDGPGGRWGEVAARLDEALPAPVDTVLVQPDLTVVVPGQPVPDLARELALVADLESSGGAAVFRVSEATLRRAFDAGRSGADLLEFFTTRSVTPLPQALRYQIEDLGRRYGALRAGAAGGYLRCDDEELLSRVVAEPRLAATGLRRLAPTVAVCTTTPAKLLAALRAAGFAPAAESPAGTVLAVDEAPPRAPARRAARPVRTTTPGPEQLGAIVARMRSGEELAALRAVQQATVPTVPGVTSAALLETIREAVRTSSGLWLGYAEDGGGVVARTIAPISMAGGQVRGYGAGGRLETYQLHRIVTARVLETDE